MHPEPEGDTMRLVEELLAKVLHASPQGRPAALEAACQDNPSVAGRLRQRLRHLARFGFLEGLDADDSGDAGRPSRIGPYSILGELGHGGMGVVYLAQHEELGRKVALKCIRRDLLGSHRARQRFERETRAIARLEHPGLCRLYETGDWRGQPFLAMQFVSGEPLDLQLRRARAAGYSSWSPALSDDRGGTGSGSDSSGTGTRRRSGGLRGAVRQTVDLLATLCEAVHQVHEAGLVHRDLKPANIMISPEGQPVLLDFGLARDLLDEAPALTLSSDVVGTPAYMAPEQIEPRGRALDARTDVHALGAILYECLTLRAPFGGGGREETYRRILTSEPIELRQLQPAATRDLASIVHRALAKEPRRRFATALELAEELRRVQRGEPTRTRPAGPFRRTAAWVRQRPVLAGVVVTLLVSLAIGLVISLRLLRDAEAAVRTYQAVEQTRRDPARGAVAAARALDLGGDEPARSALYEALTDLRLVRSWPLRSVGTAMAASPDGGIVAVSEWANSVRLFRDGRFRDLAVNGRPRSIDLDEEQDRILVTGHLTSAHLFDLHGELIAALDGQPPEVMAKLDVDSRHDRVPYGLMAGGIQDEVVFTVSRDGQVRVFDLEGVPQPERGFRQDPGEDEWLSADRDPDSGRWLLGSLEGRVLLCDAGGEPVPSGAASLPGRVLFVAFAPGGKRWLAATGYHRQWRDVDGRATHSSHVVRVFDRDGGAQDLGGHRGYLTEVRWANGSRFLTTSKDGTARVWTLPDVLGSAEPVCVVLSHGQPVSHGVFLPDGAVTGTIGGEAVVWHRHGGRLAELRGHVSGVYSVSVVDNGDRVLTTSLDNRLLLWDKRSRWCRERVTDESGLVAAFHGLNGRSIWSVVAAGVLRSWDPVEDRIVSTIDVRPHLRSRDRLERLSSGVTWPARGTLVVGTSQGRVLEIDPADGDDVQELWCPEAGRRGDRSDLPVLLLAPHSERLIAPGPEGSLQDVSRQAGSALPPLGEVHPRWLPGSIAGHPTEAWFARPKAGGGLVAQRTDAPSPPRSLSTPGNRVMSLAWAGSQTRLIAALRDGEVVAFDTELRELWRNDLRVHLSRVTASADGGLIAVVGGDQRVRVLDDTGALRLTLPRFPGNVLVARVSPDGRSLLVASREGHLRVWPLLLDESGHEILQGSPYGEALDLAHQELGRENAEK